MTRQAIRPRRTWTFVGAGAGLLNLNFLAELGLPRHTPIGSTVVSDLSVPGQPWSGLFRLADVAAATLLLLVCLAAWLRRSLVRERWSRRSWHAGTLMLALFAVSTIAAAAVTEHCVPATSVACSQSLAEQSWQDVVHDVVSSVGTSLAVLAALAFAIAGRRSTRRALVHAAAFVGAAVSGIVFLALQAGGATGLLGWVQRLQILVLSAWFVAVGRTVDAHS